MSSFLASLLKPLLVLLAAWSSGKKAGKDAAKIEELQSYVDTTKRMDAVGNMSDAHAAGEWLRNRAKH